jgi:hypothetical protein
MSPTRRQPAHELRRAGLTRDRVLGTAVELADEEGLDGLSMRKLAKRLGVVPNLYADWHSSRPLHSVTAGFTWTGTGDYGASRPGRILSSYDGIARPPRLRILIAVMAAVAMTSTAMAAPMAASR